MQSLAEELLEAADALERFTPSTVAPEITSALQKLEDATIAVGKAWSGSSLGYHANIYYAKLEPSPPGAHFSQEWGFKQLQTIPTTSGDWHEYDAEGVKAKIYEMAGHPSLEDAHALAARASEEFEKRKSEAASLLTTALKEADDSFLGAVKNDVENLTVLDRAAIADRLTPGGQVMSRDAIAVGQGFRTPPHLAVRADVLACRVPLEACKRLAVACRKAGSHLQRSERRRTRLRTVGTNVFIGHGGSSAWRDLKDFVKDRLNLPWDEFNRVPVAGITNVARLSEMLDSAAIAFLVMTAEDERADGTRQARMNVIHEAGLFQGRLGFSRAIVLLEDGCEEFSNIEGLGQIRFPKGDISAKFEDIRRVLEREGLLPGSKGG